MRFRISCAVGALVLAACQFDAAGLGNAPEGVCGDGVVDPGEQCDDGNAVAGDGCDGSCRLEAACGADTCPAGCCDAQGSCQAGTANAACGAGGEACVDCAASSLVCGAGGTCAAPPPCDPGDLMDCGNCGVQVCDAHGQWGPCQDEGVCSPGQVDTGTDCAYCGHEERVCQPTCAWGGWVCVDQGACLPGQVETGGACGTCGHDERSCGASCDWGSWSCVGADPTTYYADADLDGYGNPNVSTTACGGPPTGYVSNDDDCADNNPGVNPGVTEACGNCVDEDCDGTAQACDPTASIELRPDPPVSGQPLQIVVTSNTAHTCVGLAIASGGSVVRLTSPTVGSGPPYEWIFNLTAGSAGNYLVTFFAGPAPCGNGTASPVICRRMIVP